MDVTVWLARRWWLIPVLVIVTGGSAAVNFGAGGDFHTMGDLTGGLAAVVLAALAAGSLFALDRWPATLVLTGALVGGYFAVGGENGPIFFVIVVASFLLATRRPFGGWFALLVLASILVWAGLTVRGVRWDDVSVGLWQSVGVGAIVAAATAVGTALRIGAEARAERIGRTATEERLRMAQDLHDGVGHGLAVIAMQAGVALHVLDQDPAKARASLEAIRATSRESLDALRSELAVMSGGAPRRPAAGLDELPALLDRVRAAGLRVDVSGEPGEVSEQVGEVSYVVVQEALTNVLRHAGATTATIAWRRTADRLTLAVSDDGRGGSVQDEGMGIGGMRARLARLGGSLSAGPRDGGGFEVVAELPA